MSEIEKISEELKDKATLEDKVAKDPKAEEEDEDDEDDEDNQGGATEGKKKKKKRSNKKKKKTVKIVCEAPPPTPGEDGNMPHSRLIGGTTDYFVKYGQTNPPTKSADEIFTNGVFPSGLSQPHGKTKYPTTSVWSRSTDQEKSAREKENEPYYQKLRKAAEVHRQVRAHAQSFIKPGIDLHEMCERLEDTNRLIMAERGLERGIGFPTGCSINHVAAHYSPNPGDKVTLKYGDVMKVDFGCQIEGSIIDSAWTVAFDPQFDPLLNAVKEATNAGIKAAGIDVQMCEIGALIQEVMESHEITLPDRKTQKSVLSPTGSQTVLPLKTFQIKVCRNLNGHNIGKYQIHGGKSVPITDNGDTTRMEEGELFAIETFGSTGDGYVVEEGDCSHYMKNFHIHSNNIHVPLTNNSHKKLLNHINKTFSTLPFCKRWLNRVDGGSFFVNNTAGRIENINQNIKALTNAGIIDAYPPLVDTYGEGCYVAQFEHTFILKPTSKEILSFGEDY